VSATDKLCCWDCHYLPFIYALNFCNYFIIALFTKQVQPGDSLILSVSKAPLIVAQVLSDTQLVLKTFSSSSATSTPTLPKGSPTPDNKLQQKRASLASLSLLPNNSGTACFYKIVPKIDQSVLFSSVTQKFLQGRSVGIFPEGGSHDRSDLLPMKAGAAIMALGAMAEHPELQVKIVPVGLNYFHAEKVLLAYFNILNIYIYLL
jgi:hypothetical protein